MEYGYIVALVSFLFYTMINDFRLNHVLRHASYLFCMKFQVHDYILFCLFNMPLFSDQVL